MKPIRAYISAGSNLGNREAHLEHALDELEQAGTVLQASSCFETEPVGYADQPWFLNLAIELETRLTPSGLLHLCLGIEASRDRERSFPNAPRTLDLDILLYGDFVVQEEKLIIPHPRLVERRFVLEPLAEIAPDLLHPVLKKSVRSLLAACTDTSRIRRLSPPARFCH
jgi:2-amino-4-hydroxy-6-hydroxymethyldihydropteridine diphosphokinase